MLRFVVISCAALALAGCATVPPPALAISDLARYRIADVAVENVEVIDSWPAEEEIFLKKGAGGDPGAADRLRNESASHFPALKAQMQAAMTDRFRAEFGALLGQTLSGPRPVKAVVRLKTFDIPSTLKRVLIDQNTKMQADIDLVDATTGAVVLHYPGPYKSSRLWGGVLTPLADALRPSDTSAVMMTDYAQDYRKWMLQL